MKTSIKNLKLPAEVYLVVFISGNDVIFSMTAHYYPPKIIESGTYKNSEMRMMLKCVNE